MLYMYIYINIISEKTVDRTRGIVWYCKCYVLFRWQPSIQ